jgi:hypothetical protein
MKRFIDTTRLMHRPAELLRDPALWAWLLVALLAILPARAVLAGA